LTGNVATGGGTAGGEKKAKHYLPLDVYRQGRKQRPLDCRGWLITGSLGSDHKGGRDLCDPLAYAMLKRIWLNGGECSLRGELCGGQGGQNPLSDRWGDSFKGKELLRGSVDIVGIFVERDTVS